MIKGDTMEFDGKKYTAIESDFCCGGCAFNEKNGCPDCIDEDGFFIHWEVES